MTHSIEWKARLKCFISFIYENTNKVWYKNLWNWFLSCVCYAFVGVCLFVPCDHLLGKGWPLGYLLGCITVSLSIYNWYPWSGVVLDCIDSWYLHPYILLNLMINDLLTPPQGSRGRGQIWRIKFGRISSSGLVGDSLTNGRTEAITISPLFFFLKKMWR